MPCALSPIPCHEFRFYCTHHTLSPTTPFYHHLLPETDPAHALSTAHFLSAILTSELALLIASHMVAKPLSHRRFPEVDGEDCLSLWAFCARTGSSGQRFRFKMYPDLRAWRPNRYQRPPGLKLVEGEEVAVTEVMYFPEISGERSVWPVGYDAGRVFAARRVWSLGVV